MAEPTATVKQGQLKGITGIDLNGETYYKFLGIPYAKPPVGSLRFKAPQPAEPWTGVRDATKEGNPCVALDMKTMKPAGSEDCLFLNVFTKRLPQEGVSSKPVMVFIHGGAFTSGSGSEEMAGSKYLVAQDIVFVSINYRLGLFGFLSSDDIAIGIPGNAALKDQTLALKWLQENISSFNGDPNNVTIFGISAGGASVHFQVLSPSAKGLFHKAIAQSGSALNPWAWGQKNVIQVADKLGQKVSSEKEALDILMTASAEELFQAFLKFPDNFENLTIRRSFGPVIEKPNPTEFLTENPYDLLVSGKFNQVPLIIGTTSNEGLIYEMTKKDLLSSVTPQEVGVFWSLGLEENSQKHLEIKALLNDLYFKDGVTDEAVHKIIGDAGFVVGVLEAAKLALEKSQYPLYLYVFSYELALSNIFLTLMGVADQKFKGVPHGADIPYLFSRELKLDDIDPKSKAETLDAIRQVTKIWADFARTGRPHELWEPIKDVNQLKYFEINKESKTKINPFAERVAIWEKVLKNVSRIDAHIQENATI